MSKPHVTSSWLSPPVTLSFRRWCQNSTATPVVEQREHARGHCVGMGICHGNAVEQYTWALSVLIRTLLPEGMACGHAKVETSCLLLHVLVACTLVELRQAFRRRMPQRWTCRVARVLSVGWFDLIRNLDTSLVVFLRGICSGLGSSEGGIVYGLFSKEGLYIGKASVNRTHCPGLAARLTEHIRCLYRSDLKDANKPQYRLLRRRLRGARFFPLSVFPTVSRTLAAEALAMSMEAPLGNAKDAAEERRLRRKGDNAKVGALRRRPSSWRRRRVRPWESILGCSAVKEVLSNQSRGKPVQFPGALGLDIPLSSLYTAQIREEHAHCGSHGPLYLFDPCRLGLLLANCAKGSNRSNFPWILPRWPRWEIASYLYGACKQVSEFLKLPSRQCSASRVLDYLLRFPPYHPKGFQFFRCLQFSGVLDLSSENSTRLLVACGEGLLVDGCKRMWMCARRAAKGGCGASMARGSSETCSEKFKEWDVDTFAEALVLRSLRAVPGVWRLPVWEQAEDINPECFSCLRSWSFRTRIPQRIHNQL